MIEHVTSQKDEEEEHSVYVYISLNSIDSAAANSVPIKRKSFISIFFFLAIKQTWSYVVSFYFFEFYVFFLFIVIQTEM